MKTIFTIVIVLSIQIILSIISLLIVVLFFIISRIIAYKTQLKNRKEAWYLIAVVKPNLSKINIVFARLFESYKLAANDLLTNQHLVHHKYIQLRSKHIKRFKIITDTFLADVVKQITLQYPALKKDITNHLSFIEKQFEKGLAREKFSDKDIRDFKNIVYDVKSKFLHLLYKYNHSITI